MRIMNLTQHIASTEQVEQGVIEPQDKEYVNNLLTFETIPTNYDIKNKAIKLAIYTKLHNVKYAMIGGALYLMSSLEKELIKLGITPLYSFSKRISSEKVVKNKTIKTNVFKHINFIKVQD